MEVEGYRVLAFRFQESLNTTNVGRSSSGQEMRMTLMSQISRIRREIDRPNTLSYSPRSASLMDSRSQSRIRIRFISDIRRIRSFFRTNDHGLTRPMSIMRSVRVIACCLALGAV